MKGGPNDERKQMMYCNSNTDMTTIYPCSMEQSWEFFGGSYDRCTK